MAGVTSCENTLHVLSDLNEQQSGMYSNKSSMEMLKGCALFFFLFLSFFGKQKTSKNVGLLRFGERDSGQFQEVNTSRTRDSATLQGGIGEIINVSSRTPRSGLKLAEFSFSSKKMSFWNQVICMFLTP